MRIGLFTGSAARIGSGAGMVTPLARALAKTDNETFIIEATRARSRGRSIDGLSVWFQSIMPFLVEHPRVALDLGMSKMSSRFEAATGIDRGPQAYDLVIGACQAAAARRLDLDVLYSFHNFNAVGPLFANLPVPLSFVINLVGFGIDPSRGGAADTFPLQSQIFARPRWDLHIAATHFEFSQYQAVYRKLGISEEKLRFLPHSYDVDVLYPVSEAERRYLRQAYKVDNAELVMVYPVNIYRRKNIEMAIAIAAALNKKLNSMLVLSGRVWDDRYAAELVEQAQQRDVAGKIVFLDGVPFSQMREVYNLADVTVYPSHQETFGLGLIESLGCGTPVVGPGWISPCQEILLTAVGGHVVGKEPHEFVSRVLEAVFEDAPSRQEIANDARTRFGNETISKRFLEAVLPVRRSRRRWVETLESLRWKQMYHDAGELL